jgi:hypothetical protein
LGILQEAHGNYEVGCLGQKDLPPESTQHMPQHPPPLHTAPNANAMFGNICHCLMCIQKQKNSNIR